MADAVLLVRRERVRVLEDKERSAQPRGHGHNAKEQQRPVTLHWIDANWNLRSVIIGFIRAEYPHTGVRLADHLLDVVKSMDGTLLHTIWAITTDNATNNASMVRSIKAKLPHEVEAHAEATMPSSAAAMTAESSAMLSEPHDVFQVRCLAHVLQLAVKEGLKVCSIIDTSIGHIRDVLKKLTESIALNEELKRACKVLKVTFRQPELDCVTRWNSTWEMVLSAIHLRKPIEELLHRIREGHEGYTDYAIKADDRLAYSLGDEAWAMLTEFCSFLTPVKAATTMMSEKNYPTFGMAVVVFTLISNHAAKVALHANSSFTADFATVFKSKLGEYTAHVKSREAQIAAVLDPRAKSLLPSIVDDMGTIRQYVLDEYGSSYKARFERQQQEASSPRLSQQEERDAALGEALFQLIDDTFGSDEPASFEGESFASELDRWMAHRDKTMNSKTSSHEVCAWMRSLDQFPRIQLMARDFLAVMATSVPSEQAFSAAGTTVSKRRARLGDDAVTAISELQSFLDFNEATLKLEADGTSE